MSRRHQPPSSEGTLRVESPGELPTEPGQRDEGSALMLALVFILVGSLLVVPLLSYARSVIAAGRVQVGKVERAEATRGNLRTVLADPKALFDACSASGPTVAVNLAAAQLAIPTKVTCNTLKDQTEMDGAQLRLSMATVQVGSTMPIGTVGNSYAGSGGADPAAWLTVADATSGGGKIWTPALPTHGLNHPSPAGYMMPAWSGSCRVFFPGTYEDPVTVNDSVPTYFTSGVYYFENTVTFSGAAKVVVGSGATPGCTEDQEAAFNAVNAPNIVNISGIGATFVLGNLARLVITDGGGAVGPSVHFNSRLVFETDLGNLVSQGVSIMSVNGVTTGATSSVDLNLPGQLFVPRSVTESNPTDAVAPVDAATTGYRPSTLVPTIAPIPPALPIIDMSFTGAGAATVFVPGYVSVPQGQINFNLGVGMNVNKEIHLVGGVLAAVFTTVGDPVELAAMAAPPDSGRLQFGLVNRVVQKTFKLISQTTVGNPHMVSVAIVQINDYGEIAINSWVTSLG